MAHHLAHEIRDLLTESAWPRRVEVTLGRSDSAWDPCSERPIYGPTVVTYLEYRDGFIEVLARDLV